MSLSYCLHLLLLISPLPHLFCGKAFIVNLAMQPLGRGLKEKGGKQHRCWQFSRQPTLFTGWCIIYLLPPILTLHELLYLVLGLVLRFSRILFSFALGWGKGSGATCEFNVSRVTIGLLQIVAAPTYVRGHTLGLIFVQSRWDTIWKQKILTSAHVCRQLTSSFNCTSWTSTKLVG